MAAESQKDVTMVLIVSSLSENRSVQLLLKLVERGCCHTAHMRLLHTVKLGNAKLHRLTNICMPGMWIHPVDAVRNPG